MPVVTSNLGLGIKPAGIQDIRLKGYLKKNANTGGGIITVVSSTENGSATTTSANTGLRVNYLRGGRRYFVELRARAQNATVANGTRLQLVLTGTQTNAVLIGDLAVSTSVAFGTPAVANLTAVAAGTYYVPTLSPALATDYMLNGATGGAAVNYVFTGLLVPQNDGDLVVAVGSGVNNTQSSLAVGSALQVKEITF